MHWVLYVYSILLCGSIKLLINELNQIHDYNCNTDSLRVKLHRLKTTEHYTPSVDPNPSQVSPIYITNSTEASPYKSSVRVLFTPVITKMLCHHSYKTH